MVINETDSNLLVRLHRYAKGLDENFLTEAFAHLLEYLRDAEPELFRNVVQLLVADSDRHVPQLAGAEPALWTIETQVTIEHDRPDLVLKRKKGEGAEGVLILVECKLRAEASASQLKRYRDQLNAALRLSPVLKTALVLLTSDVIEKRVVELADRSLRWQDMGALLESQYALLCSPASRFVLAQFTGFLRQRGVLMDAVSRELLPGVKALNNLKMMMEAAGKSLGFAAGAGGGSGFIGWYLKKGDANQFWIAAYHSEPGVLWISSQFPVSAEVKSRWGTRVPPRGEMIPGDTRRWQIRHDLTDSMLSFFDRPAAAQQKVIEGLIQEAMEVTGFSFAAMPAPLPSAG